MPLPSPNPDLAVAFLTGGQLAGPLLAEASLLRDEGHGRTVTYSRKVFIPITTLCRDTCTYCTFVKPPGGGGEYLTPDDVLAIAQAGDEQECTEALLRSGCNDVGGTLMDESISRAAGASHGTEATPADFRNLISDLDRNPVRRTTTYERIESGLTIV